MAPKVEFPIRAKLLLLISSVVLAATAIYLLLAIRLFREDKTALIYEMNASTAKTLAAQTEALLLKVADKVTLLTQGHREEAWVRAVFSAEPDLIAYTLYRPTQDATQWQIESSFRNDNYLKLYGKTDAEVELLHEQIPVPFAKALSKRVWAMNSTLQGGAPVMTLALALELQAPGEPAKQRIAVVDLRLDRILRLVSGSAGSGEIATTYLVDGDGAILAHPDSALVSGRASLAEVPIVRSALQSPVALQIHPFDWKGERWLGAYASVGLGGLTVISQVPESQAFHASRKLIEKSVLFGLIVVTGGMLIAGLLSRSFTDPIEKLVEGTERLSRWEFGQSIHVRTRDEIGRLARAFNAMANDLQSQRSQLESSHAELEIKVKERTADLENQKKQLTEAQEALIRTTRLAALGELAGSAAHEILNPINNVTIRLERIRDRLKGQKDDLHLLGEITSSWLKAYQSGGWKEMVKELEKPNQSGSKKLIEEDLENLKAISADAAKGLSDYAEDVAFIDGENVRVTRLINGMRSLSRVGGERKQLDIHQPIDETLVTLADIVRKRGVTLIKDFAAESRENFIVQGDKDELVQVFSNLLRNSLQAIDSEKGKKGSIRISTCRREKRIEVRIQDTGAGIDPKDIPRLFESNFTTKSVEEGTGLGLSISRRLARAFGGDIELEKTVPGEGTTFLVWFPVAV